MMVAAQLISNKIELQVKESIEYVSENEELFEETNIESQQYEQEAV
jgi:hypothetical protein